MSYYQPQRVTDQRGNIWHVLIAWGFAVFTFAYFLPWAIAATRHKSNTLAIALVNLLLGWTLVGWVVALVMACGSHQMAVISPPGYPPPPGYLPPVPPHSHLPPAGHAQGYLSPAPAAPQALEMPEQVSQPHIEAAQPTEGAELPRD
jgi:hypothetical protein